MTAPRYSATLEWLCDHAAIARIHDGPDGRHGDPYVWFTVVSGDPSRGQPATLKGADRPLPWGALRPLCEELRAAGFSGRAHERYEDGRIRLVWKSL
jgi:hypothetical protein